MADVYRALNALRDEKIVENYAICGGTAALFYDTETLRTFDIDVYVDLPQSGFLVSLAPIYEWAKARGYGIEGEHLIIHGVPVQIIVVGDGVERDALENANWLKYDGVSVAVVRPEYLVLIYGKVRGRNRLVRAGDLIENAALDARLLEQIIEKHDLRSVWEALNA